MNLKAICKKLVFVSLCAGMAGSIGGCSSAQPVFPLSTLPDEMKEEYNPSIDIVNTLEQSRTVTDDTEINPNSILAESSFDVYFDNTTGCFLGYVKAKEKDKNDIGYQMFSKTMTSFKDTFDCSDSYKTYTLQPDDKKTLTWKEYATNVLKDFGNKGAYTSSDPSSDFATGQAPVTMWLDKVNSLIAEGGNSTIVYISDLNENYGLLSETGTAIKDILNSNPEKDLLIISYVLPYKGEISAPTFDNEGDSKSQVDTKEFKETVNRCYYALVFGEHNTLKALCTKVEEGFRDINLPMNAYMYRDFFYSESETLTKNKSGEKIEDQNFIQNNPPVLNITDKDGNIISDDEVPEKKQEEKSDENNNSDDDLFGDAENSKDVDDSGSQKLDNLKISDDFTRFFNEKFSGESYMFINTIPNQGDLGAAVSIKLENTDIYDLDADNAVIYTYVPEAGSGSLYAEENAESGWIKSDSMKGSIWESEINDDTVSIKLTETLSSDTVPSILISVPVTFSYTKESISSDVINISQEFREWVNDCKVPDILTAENEEQKYTKTYGFDSFIDKITGYKSMPEEGNKISDAPDVVSEKETVCRVNLIVVFDENLK
ncbi:MAG: hypothetical protein J6I55_07235 [Ruminococcus sp.]|nr:hypothetical protein [Ruminococcus sp.]